jgi:geranylgeranyl reductase
MQTLLRRRAEEAGVTMIQGAFRRFRHAEGDYPVLEIQRHGSDEREELACDVVVAADGVHSRVARSLRMPANELGVAYLETLTPPPGAKSGGVESAQLHFGRKVSADAYGWLVPYQDHWQLGVATQARYGKRVWDMLAELKKRLGGTLDGAKPVGRESFCYPLRPRKTLASDRVLFVGDAAGLGAAATRDGLYFACKSGLMAAETIVRHQNVPLPERLSDYERDFWAEFGTVFDDFGRLEDHYFQQDRRREVLVDLGWDREIAKVAVDAFADKRRFAPPLPLALKIKARLVGQLVKASLNQRKRPEPEFHHRILPAGENYLELALKSSTGPLKAQLRPQLEITVPKAAPVVPVAEDGVQALPTETP